MTSKDVQKFAVGIELPTSGDYLCKSITRLEDNFVGVTLVKGNEEINALMIPEDETYVKFIDQKVEVVFRTEIVHTVTCIYINNMTHLAEVALIPHEELFKLYLDEPSPIGTDIKFKDLTEGKPYKSVKLYCIKNTYNYSEKAFWAQYRLMDRDRNVITGRCFSPAYEDRDHTGKYIMADVIKTKYGLNLDNIHVLNSGVITVNPIISVAKNYILRIVEKLSDNAQKCIRASRLLDSLETRIPDEEYEVGFDLVRIALSLSLLEPFKNISKTIDFTTMQEALILDNLHLLYKREELSNYSNNMLALARFNAMGNIKLLSLITDKSDNITIERKILEDVKRMTNVAIEATVSEV